MSRCLSASFAIKRSAKIQLNPINLTLHLQCYFYTLFVPPNLKAVWKVIEVRFFAS